MSVFTELQHVITSDWGWLAAVAIFLYQVTWPGWDTQLQQLLTSSNEDLRSDIATVHNRIESVDEKISDVQSKQLTMIQVVRAEAATNDEIDEDAVDEYLAENGVQKDYFFSDDRRWFDDDHDHADD